MRSFTRPITILLFLCLPLAAALAQPREINGRILDEKDEPLMGVNIRLAGAAGGTISDLEGRYSLRANDGERLIFTYVGYADEEVTVAGQRTIDVRMRPGAQLNEVVVAALGISREKKALGYAAQEVSGERLVAARQPNLLNALQGLAAGAQITSAGGGPGQGARIVIRGVNSLDPAANNQPLFVVDGVPIDNSTHSDGGGGRNLSNRLTDLNPDDIERISVLKGGAATALYGVRAANGAVIISTKRGQAGRLSVDFSSSATLEEVNKFPELQQTYTQGYRGEYDPNSFWPAWGPSIDDARREDPSHPPALFHNFRNAYRQGSQWRHHLSIAGGAQQASFRASIARLDHEGVIPFSNYRNTSLRFNGDIQANDKFSFGGGLNYVNSGGDRVSAQRFNERLVYWSPRVDVNDYQFPDGTMKGYRNEGRLGNNPIYGAGVNQFTDNVDRFIGNLRLRWTPAPWLGLSYQLGMDQFAENRHHRAPSPRGVENENIFEDNGLGFVNESRINRRDISATFSADARFRLGEKWRLNALLGHDLFDQRFDRLNVNGRELAIWNLFSLNNASVVTTDDYKELYRLFGLYGEISLAFDNALFLTGAGRNDWSSALPRHGRAFFYPSVSLGYVFTEAFDMPMWWNFGKLRASYAGIGKDTRPYRLNTVYEPAPGFPIGNTTGWTRGGQKGAPDLRPERTHTVELGADLRFWRNRLALDIAWYLARSKDQIIPVPVSAAAGFSSFILNAGEIENRGLELSVQATAIQSRHFQWSIMLNYAANRNMVRSIQEGISDIFLGSHFGYVGSSASLRLVAGQPYGNLYGRGYARYYADPSEDDGIELDKSRPLLIGDDGFPILDTRQRILGNATPRWFGALVNTFSWRQFELSFMIDTRQGVHKYNQLGNFLSAFGLAPYTLDRERTVVFEGVGADGAPNTRAVYLGQGTGPDGVNYGDGYYRNLHRAATEHFVEDASWIRLRQLSLGYRLPKAWLERSPLARAQLVFSAYNLWLSTPFSGFDPEGNRGVDNGDDGFGGFIYPGTRGFTFTLSIGL